MCTLLEILDTDAQPQWADTLHDPKPEAEDYAPDEVPEGLREKPEPAPNPRPLESIPVDIRPSKLGKMVISGTNEEVQNFLEAHPDAKTRELPITPELKQKVLDKLEQWRRVGDDRELAKIRSVLAADDLPPVIIHTYPNGKIGILDGWHRLVAYVVTERETIVGYEMADLAEGSREKPEPVAAKPVPAPVPVKPRPLRGEALINVSHTVMQSLGVTSESATFPEIEAAMPGKLLEPKSPAIFDPKVDKVWVNTDAPYWASPSKTLKLSKQQNWFAVNTPEQVAYHEAVHSLHFRKILAAEGGDQERAIKRMGRMSLNEFPIPLRRTIQKEVGRYAAINESEFVAEVGGAIRQGETYSEPIIALYQELLGP